ncbi:hypothetical protein NDN08_003326 [Rhodosorus marinus]|uniref:Pyrimidine 5'-nucleotidase n=1 Tax=Rhodosorus marinus TaxID=101924 RepID=A0AAV8UZV2_9RHOD|nr:hypothetical protein NDN08_003326 [Rhodosorus marinus]
MDGAGVLVCEAGCCETEVCDKVERNPLFTDLSTVRTLFFDCDDTLYPRSSGVDVIVRNNIALYMERELKIPKDEIPKLRQDLYVQYGTTLRGLQEEHDVDPNHYWEFVHGTLDYRNLLQPNPGLAKILKSLPQKKWVFTNANVEHAEACLKQLGLDNGIFEGIIDVRAMDFANKPSPASFISAMRISGEADASKILFFDDSSKNLEGARKHGIHTVRISDDKSRTILDVAQMQEIDEISHSLADLWKYNEGLPSV